MREWWVNRSVLCICMMFLNNKKERKKEMPSFKINRKAKCGGWQTPLKPSNWETKAGDLCELEVNLIYLASSMPARVT